MPKIHPIELRERVVAYVEEGHTHRDAALHFRVSVKFVNDMVKLKRETGDLQRKVIPGRLGKGKLEVHKDWICQRVAEKGDITLDQLAIELKQSFDLDVHRWSVGRLLHRLGLTHKKRPSTPVSKNAAMLPRRVISGS